MKRAFSLQDTAPLVDLTADLWAARRRQAVIWAVIVAGLVTFYSSITAYVVPKPPSKMGMYWPAKEDSGLSIAELAQLMGAATAMGVAITAVQDLAWPFMSKHRKGEKVFFISSISVRIAFLATLAYHHYGPRGWDVASSGNDTYRKFLMALFYAGYTTDLVQMWRRPQEFARSFTGFMTTHHLLSFAWFTPWLIFMAPRGVEGGPIWNTTFIYLCAAVPNHTYKLVSCWFKPDWYGLLMGPAIYAHWLILLTSQAYYFTQCACSAWGCWYPATVMMLIGAWGMAVWDVPNFLDSIVLCNSKMFGTQIGFYDIVPLLLGRGRPSIAPTAAALAAAAAPAPAGTAAVQHAPKSTLSTINSVVSEETSSTAEPPVTVELVLRPTTQNKSSKSFDLDAILAAAAEAAAATKAGADLDMAIFSKVVSLQAGGSQATSFGLAPGERKGEKHVLARGKARTLAESKAAAAASEADDLDLGVFSKVVSLQAGGTQAMSFGLAPGERKGDRLSARRRFFSGTSVRAL